MPKPKIKVGEKAQKFFVGEILKANDAERTVTGIASHESPDRDGDVIRQNGWDLKNFKKNAVMPWGHDYHGLPVAKIVKTWIEGKKLMFTAKFAGEEQAHPFAETVYRLFRDGFLKAFSVGFIPKKLKPNPNTNGFLIEEAELLEVSAVLVPAHQGALATSVKSFTKKYGCDEAEDDAVIAFLKEAMVDHDELEKEGGLIETTTAEKAVEESEGELQYKIREVSEFQDESLITREVQKEPAIFGVFGKLKNDDSEELKLQLLRFPKTDWKMEEVQEWVEKNKDELANKQYTPEKNTIKFLSNLLSEKHGELKLLRKWFAIFSEATGVGRTENEIETIDEIGQKMFGLLKTFKVIQSESTKDFVKPAANPPATKKQARTAELDENDILARVIGE